VGFIQKREWVKGGFMDQHCKRGLRSKEGMGKRWLNGQHCKKCASFKLGMGKRWLHEKQC